MGGEDRGRATLHGWAPRIHGRPCARESAKRRNRRPRGNSGPGAQHPRDRTVTVTGLITGGHPCDTLTRILVTSALLVPGGLLAPAPLAAAATPACSDARPHRVVPRRRRRRPARSTAGSCCANTSGHTCRTGGYGGVSLVGNGDGTQLGAPARRIDAAAVRTIVLRPGSAGEQPDRGDRGAQLPAQVAATPPTPTASGCTCPTPRRRSTSRTPPRGAAATAVRLIRQTALPPRLTGVVVSACGRPSA